MFPYISLCYFDGMDCGQKQNSRFILFICNKTNDSLEVQPSLGYTNQAPS